MDVQIGKGLTLPVDWDAMPDNAKQHAIYIGLRNVLMDSHAGVSTDEPDYQEKALAVAEKKLAALMAGEVRVGSTREADPVRSEALHIATARIKAAIRKAGKKVGKADPKAIREAAQKLVDKDPTIMVAAGRNVAERSAAPDDLIEGL